MIKRAGFVNFRILGEVEVELEPFTIFVGPNASGKSTILDGLNRICSCRYGSVNPLLANRDWIEGRDVPSPNDLLTKQKEANELVFFIKGTTFAITSISFDTRYLPADADSATKVWGFSVNSASFRPLTNPSNYVTSKEAALFEKLPDSIHLRLSGDRLAIPNRISPKFSTIQSDGTGLAAMLGSIRLKSEDRFTQIQIMLRQVVPSVKRVYLDTAGSQSDEYKIFIDFENAKGIPAEVVSEGTLFALAILAVATDSENDWLILLDDLERGLHPLAVGDLVNVLKKLVKENPKLQIVATTHSPDLLNYVDAHEVRVVNLNEQGHTIVAKLTDHPDYERWKDTLKPGEFWAEVGENWVKRQVVER
jgi:predicted ATPase